MGKIKNLFSKVKKIALNHKKFSIFLFIILIIAMYFLWPKGAKPILTKVITKQDVIKTVSVTGTIAAETQVNLTFQSAEKLSYVGVKLGDSIIRYALIASLDQNQLQATLRQAQQDFTAAKAASEQYYDGHKNATESYDEKVTRTALDAAQNKAYDQMQKVLNDIANSSLYSPIEGIVTRMDAQTAGVNITPATVFTITDPNSLNFEIEVDEADIGLVTIGQDINVSLDAFPNENLKLKVNKIDFVSHITSSGGNVFYVKALLPSSDKYRIGISGNADIIVGAKYNVLTVPSSSIFNDNYVYVKTDNGFEKRKIELGLQSDIDAQVLSGLTQGETVAIDPSSVPQNLIVKN